MTLRVREELKPCPTVSLDAKNDLLRTVLCIQGLTDNDNILKLTRMLLSDIEKFHLQAQDKQ